MEIDSLNDKLFSRNFELKLIATTKYYKEVVNGLVKDYPDYISEYDVIESLDELKFSDNSFKIAFILLDELDDNNTKLINDLAIAKLDLTIVITRRNDKLYELKNLVDKVYLVDETSLNEFGFDFLVKKIILWHYLIINRNYLTPFYLEDYLAEIKDTKLVSKIYVKRVNQEFSSADFIDARRYLEGLTDFNCDTKYFLGVILNKYQEYQGLHPFLKSNSILNDMSKNYLGFNINCDDSLEEDEAYMFIIYC